MSALPAAFGLAAVLLAAPAAACALLDLPLGEPRSAIDEEMAAQDIRPVRLGRQAQLVEAPCLPRVYAAQTVHLRFEDEALAEITLRIVPEPATSGPELLRLLSEVRAELLRMLGPPTWEVSRPPSSPERALVELSDGTAEQILQWNGARTVRGGVPRRVDGEVVVEVLVTSRPLDRHEPFWASDRF